MEARCCCSITVVCMQSCWGANSSLVSWAASFARAGHIQLCLHLFKSVRVVRKSKLCVTIPRPKTSLPTCSSTEKLRPCTLNSHLASISGKPSSQNVLGPSSKVPGGVANSAAGDLSPTTMPTRRAGPKSFESPGF